MFIIVTLYVANKLKIIYSGRGDMATKFAQFTKYIKTYYNSIFTALITSFASAVNVNNKAVVSHLSCSLKVRYGINNNDNKQFSSCQLSEFRWKNRSYRRQFTNNTFRLLVLVINVSKNILFK